MRPGFAELESRTAPSVLHYHGGPVLRRPVVENVYYGAAWRQLPAAERYLSRFTGAVAADGYTDVLRQYGVGPARDAGARTLTHGADASDTGIRAELNAAIDSGTLDPAANLYVVYLPPHVPGSIGSGPGQTLAGLYDYVGYHDSFYAPRLHRTVAYAVVVWPDLYPTPTGRQRADILTQTASHEIAEAITDPVSRGWYARDGEEIADLAAGNGGDYDGYAVELLWSDAAGDLVAPASRKP